MEANLDMGNLGKRSGIKYVNITNGIQEIEGKISDVEDTIEENNTTVKENSKHKNLLTQNIQKIHDTMKKSNLRIIGIEESKDSQFKGPENILNKIIEENLST